ncbi:MAG: AraC family transcriptional regulator [Pseudomonadales bacterium]|nr:AraC family transcriptional regulator [Pseudomonadales bacterium]
MQSAHANHTVSSHFARRYLATAGQLGLDVDAICAYAAIPDAIIKETNSRLAPYQLARVLNKVMVDSDDEFMGLAQHPCRFGIFTLLCERLIDCKTLRQAMAETQRFYDLVTNSVLFDIDETGNDAVIALKLTGKHSDRDSILLELLMLIWHRFPSWLISEVIAIRSVHMTMPAPQYANEYRLLFPCKTHFSATQNAMVWPKHALDQPIKRNPEQLQRYLAKVPLVWFRKLQFEDIQTDKILLMLKQCDDLQAITLEHIADQLHMTSRTLRRKLTAEGSQFQNLKDSVRRERAIYWLSQQGISIKETAQKVGYTETASFVRAFKQWTGLSPGQFRKSLQPKD